MSIPYNKIKNQVQFSKRSKNISFGHANWSQADCIPHAHVTDDPNAFFLSRSKIEHGIIRLLISFQNRNKTMFMSQGKIARLLGVSRIWINTLVGRLEEHGILITKYRHMHSSLYKLSSWFYRADISLKLSWLFPTIKKALMASYLLNAASGAVIEGEFTHINLDYNYLFSSFTSTSTSRRLSSKNVQGVVMDATISDAIKGIKSLNLTLAGQIMLSPFSDEAIRHADKAFKYNETVKNPFGLFHAICRNYCKNNKIAPNWELYRSLMQKYSIQPNAEMLKELPKAKEQKKEQPKPSAWESHDKRFTQGCMMDHEKSIRDFKGILERLPHDIELQKKAALLGGAGYIKACLTNHIDCLTTNHGQQVPETGMQESFSTNDNKNGMTESWADYDANPDLYEEVYEY